MDLFTPYFPRGNRAVALWHKNAHSISGVWSSAPVARPTTTAARRHGGGGGGGGSMALADSRPRRRAARRQQCMVAHYPLVIHKFSTSQQFS